MIKFAKCLENVHLLWGSQDAIFVFKWFCEGCETWACRDQIQLSPPLLPSASRPHPPPPKKSSPGFHHCLLYLQQQAAKRQTTVSVQSLSDRSLAADQKHFQTKTYIK